MPILSETLAINKTKLDINAQLDYTGFSVESLLKLAVENCAEFVSRNFDRLRTKNLCL